MFIVKIDIFSDIIFRLLVTVQKANAPLLSVNVIINKTHAFLCSVETTDKASYRFNVYAKYKIIPHLVAK